MNIKSAKNLIFAVFSSLIFIIPRAVLADVNPLRFWVMPNELGANADMPKTPDEVRKYLREIREHGDYYIENSVQDLLSPSGIGKDTALIHYVKGSQILSEIGAFVKANGIKTPVAVEFIRWGDAYQRLSLAVNHKDAGSSPDALQIGSTWTADFAGKGAFVPLNNVIDKDEFIKTALQSAVPVGNDKLFAVPWFIDARFLFLNAGVVKWQDIFESWDSLQKECTKRNTASPKLIVFPISMEWGLMHNLAPWIWSAGGDIISANDISLLTKYKILVDSRASLNAVEFLRSLSETGCADFVDASTDELENRFIGGQYASIISGPWLIKKLGADFGNKYYISPLPRGEAGSVTFIGGSNLAVFRDAGKRGNLDRAIDLIKFLSSANIQYSYAIKTGFLPANVSALKKYSNQIKTDIILNIVADGKSYPPIPEWGDVVEKDIVRNHIWHLWNLIATAKSPSVIENTLHDTAAEMKKRLGVINFMEKLPYLLAGAGGIFFILIVFFFTQEYRVLDYLGEAELPSFIFSRDLSIDSAMSLSKSLRKRL